MGHGLFDQLPLCSIPICGHVWLIRGAGNFEHCSASLLLHIRSMQQVLEVEMATVSCPADICMMQQRSNILMGGIVCSSFVL